MRFSSPLLCGTALLIGGMLTPLPLAAKKIPVKLPPEAFAMTPEDRARHALNRLAYGPRPGETARLAVPGALEAWINGQLYPNKIKEIDLERRLKALPLAALDQDEIQAEILKPFLAAHREPDADPKQSDDEKAEKTRAHWESAATSDPKVKELADQWQRAKILRAVYAERQLEAVLTDFWFNHFNVDMGDRLTRFTVQDYEREVIQSQLFDSFRDLLGATARHPAMLFYLENERSTRAAGAPGLAVYVNRGYGMFDDPFDNWDHYHRIYYRDAAGGLHAGAAHHLDLGYHHDYWNSFGWGDDWVGTRRRVSPGNSKTLDAEMTGPITRYARALLDLHTLGTGNYSDKDVSESARVFTGWSLDSPAKQIGFRFYPPAHDANDAIVLGQEFSGRDGEREGEALLDLLAEHPATARRIAGKFARRFAGDDPPAGLVDKLAAVYTASGGDLRALTVALIESPEFWRTTPDDPARTPLEWAAALLRAGGAETDGRGPLSALNNLGMPPYRCTDPAGYPRDAAVWRGENSLKMRRDLADRLAAGQWEGTKLSPKPFLPGAVIRAVMRMKAIFSLAAFSFTAIFLLADRPVKKTGIKLPPEAYALSPEARARHALNRLAFGPRPGEVARLAQPGALENWISAQLDPETLADADYQRRLQSLPLATLPQNAIYRDYAVPFYEMRKEQRQAKRAPGTGSAAAGEDQERERTPEVMAQRREQREVTAQWVQAKVLRDVYSERQLDAVLGDFWFNHFNVDMSKNVVRFTVQDYQRGAIDPNVRGNFRALLGATAHHPAMRVYLDNARSTRAENAPGLANDERRGGGGFAGGRRGGVGVGAGGSFSPRRQTRANRGQENKFTQGLNENYARELLELHTLGVDGGYTQRDVTEAARVLTGWSVEPPREGLGAAFRARAHDAGEKRVLGHDFPAGRGETEGEALLDLLAAHPATARHIAGKFARHFVSDSPPAALVERLAAVFTRTRGDLQALTVAVIESPEFWRSAGEKTKDPLHWTAGLLRASGGETDGSGAALALRELDMTPYHCSPPTGYQDTADMWLGGGALERRLNLAHRYARQEWAGTRYELGRLTLAPAPEAGREELIRNLLGESVSPVTRNALLESARPQPGAAESAGLATFVGLIFASPEFQKR